MQKPRTVTLLEPTWDRHVHLPMNLGMLRITQLAYPDAHTHYVGGEAQVEQLKVIAPANVLNQTRFLAWQPKLDTDTLPWHVFNSLRKLRRLPLNLTRQADLLIFCSITATVANAITLLGLAPKSCVILHGNANELDGWRSRNSVRRYFDFSSALQRYCRAGGTVLVLEEVIAQQLSAEHPWLAGHISHIPHPLIPEEATADEADGYTLTSLPIRIGFAGNATLAKGFAEFTQISTQLAQRCPGKFEFHSIGYIPKESQHLDTSSLTQKSGADLPRMEYIRRLREMHYVFVWHQDSYYAKAASGVVYDAINLGIPMLARSRAQLHHWQEAGYNIATEFSQLEEAGVFLEQLDIATERARHQKQRQDLARLRASMSLAQLAAGLHEKFPLVDTQPRMIVARRDANADGA